ncbi:MAG TPA: NAD(+) diphosphatase [Chloroflexota bacterium]|nr:NAD(+) diphosphatase [Chloroflexota bacterium]
MERLPRIPLTAGRHDRAAARRRDQAWLTEALGSQAARIIAVRSQGELLVAPADRLAAIERELLPETAELTFLGVDPSGAPVFVLDLDAHELALTDSHTFGELRTVGGSLHPDEAAMAVQAIAMVGWHRRHRFCGVCGGPTLVEEAGHSRRCTACGAQHFPRTDPAVIMIVTDGADRCVLSRRPGAPPNRWTVLSGFVEPGETPEEAVVREVLEEVGVSCRNVHYVGSQPWPFPASLMLGYHAEADYAPLTVDDELEEARWFTRAEIKQGIEDGSFAFPVSVSISRQLLLAWLNEEAEPSP